MRTTLSFFPIETNDVAKCRVQERNGDYDERTKAKEHCCIRVFSSHFLKRLSNGIRNGSFKFLETLHIVVCLFFKKKSIKSITVTI